MNSNLIDEKINAIFKSGVVNGDTTGDLRFLFLVKEICEE